MKKWDNGNRKKKIEPYKKEHFGLSVIMSFDSIYVLLLMSSTI